MIGDTQKVFGCMAEPKMFLPLLCMQRGGTTKSRSKWEILILGETKVALHAEQRCVLSSSPTFPDSTCSFVFFDDVRATRGGAVTCAKSGTDAW